MKKILFFATVLIFSFSLKTSAVPTPNIWTDFGGFYTALAPYGNWIELNDGLTVWQPFNVRSGWIPYTQGQWIWTADGWYWDSYEPYGYIVFHYGRWYYDNYYGWIWIPDYQWAPAWVQWRYDNDYIGWAPLPPYAKYSINIGIHFSINYFTPYHHWHFVTYRNFCAPHVYKYYVGSQYKSRIFSRTKYRTNYGYSGGRIINRGVNIDYIRQRSGQQIVERRIEIARDSRDFLRNNDTNRRSDVVRAYKPSRDQFTGSDRGNVVIKRGERRSSIDITGINRTPQSDVNRNNAGDLRNQTNRIENARPDVNSMRDSPERTNGSSVRRETMPRQTPQPKVERPKSIERATPREQRPQYNNRKNPPQRNEIRKESGRSYSPPARGERKDNSGNRNERKPERRIRK